MKSVNVLTKDEHDFLQANIEYAKQLFEESAAKRLKDGGTSLSSLGGVNNVEVRGKCKDFPEKTPCQEERTENGHLSSVKRALFQSEERTIVDRATKRSKITSREAKIESDSSSDDEEDEIAIPTPDVSNRRWENTSAIEQNMSPVSRLRLKRAVKNKRKSGLGERVRMAKISRNKNWQPVVRLERIDAAAVGCTVIANNDHNYSYETSKNGAGILGTSKTTPRNGLNGNNRVTEISAEDDIQLIETVCATEVKTLLRSQLTRYFKKKQVDHEASIEVIKFAANFGLITKKTSSAMLKQLPKKSATRNFHFDHFRKYLKGKQNVQNPKLIVDCVMQMICCFYVCESISFDPANVSLDTVLRRVHVERFFNEIGDEKLIQIYAKNYIHMVEYISECCLNLSAQHKALINRLCDVLEDVFNEHNPPSGVVLCNNFVTRHESFLERVDDVLLMRSRDYQFVMNYVNAYLRLECSKSSWVMKDVSLREYDRSCEVNDCLVTTVFKKQKHFRQYNIVVWRGEALKLFRYYVKYCRPSDSKYHNIFLDFLTKRPLDVELDIVKFISGVSNDEAGKLQFLKYFNLQYKSYCKQTQTEPVERSQTTSSSQTEAAEFSLAEYTEPSATAVSESLPDKTRENHSQARTMRSVGVQCSFQIFLKSKDSSKHSCLLNFKNAKYTTGIMLAPTSVNEAYITDGSVTDGVVGECEPTTT